MIDSYFLYSRFPRHSQELLVLGSQKLSELRDCIFCMNDCYINKDMSDKPDLNLLPHRNILSDGIKIQIDDLNQSQVRKNYFFLVVLIYLIDFDGFTFSIFCRIFFLPHFSTFMELFIQTQEILHRIALKRLWLGQPNIPRLVSNLIR